MRQLEWPAVRAGALVAVAVCLPIAILADVLNDDDAGAGAVWILPVLAGFTLGGWVAAKRAVETPYSSAGVAGLLAFAVIAALTIVSRSLSDEEIRYILLVANAFFAYGAAMLGAAIVSRGRA